MQILQYEGVDKALLAALPELGDRYAAEAAWHAKVGGHPEQYDVIEGMLEPFLNELLDSDKDTALIRRVFEFFEDMARSPNIEVVNLLQVGIFESLVGEPSRLRAAWKYMGAETRKIACETARIYRCEANLPENARP